MKWSVLLVVPLLLLCVEAQPPEFQVFDPETGYITTQCARGGVHLDLVQWRGARLSCITMPACASTALTSQHDTDVVLWTDLEHGESIILFEHAQLRLQCHADARVRLTTYNNYFSIADYLECQMSASLSPVDEAMLIAARHHISVNT